MHLHFSHLDVVAGHWKNWMHSSYASHFAFGYLLLVAISDFFEQTVAVNPFFTVVILMLVSFQVFISFHTHKYNFTEDTVIINWTITLINSGSSLSTAMSRTDGLAYSLGMLTWAPFWKKTVIICRSFNQYIFQHYLLSVNKSGSFFARVLEGP